MKKTPLYFFSASFLAILSSLIPTIVSAQIKLLVDYNLILVSEKTVLLTMKFENYKQSPPRNNVGCTTENGWVDNCWQNVKWQKIPNSYSDFRGGYDYIGINTIVRNGNAINFDFSGDGVYVRYAGNCRTNVLAITRATDSALDPNYSPVGNELRRRALRFACSRK
jgi:hypothetical protein